MEKTDDQIARERASVEAMRNAKANMTTVLDRVATLERALSAASSTMSTLKTYIAPGAYTYPTGNGARKCHDIADDGIAAIAKVLA